jgi:1,4-dihydroxy-2-naphthoate octaprenyltransferase
MARPSHLLLIMCVYGFGATVAWGMGRSPDMKMLVAGALVLLLVSASVHFANEYADAETDAHTQRTLFSGGSGALKRYGLPRRLPLGAAWMSLILGGIGAAAFYRVGMLSPISFILLGMGSFFGWMYSLPPLAFAWRGWGELVNASLGGVLLPLYGFATQTARIDPAAVMACLPFAGLVFNNLLATQWADRSADAAVGKFTLAVRWPSRRLRWLYLIVLGATALAVVSSHGWLVPALASWGSALALPLSIWGLARYARRRDPFPSVAAMVAFLFIQWAGWSLTAFI